MILAHRQKAVGFLYLFVLPTFRNILVFVFLVLELIIVRIGADLCALLELDELDVGEGSAAAQHQQHQDQRQGEMCIRDRFRPPPQPSSAILAGPVSGK